MSSRALLVASLLLMAPAFAADWTYNMAFTQWAGSNDASRYYTNTPEFCEARAAEIAAAGYTGVMLSGYHFRLGYLDRDDDVRRITAMIVEACHRHGLKVIEHMDLTVHYYNAYPLVFEHPDWLTVHAGDMMTRHRIFCPNNPGFQRFYLDYCARFQHETNLDAWQMDEIQWLSRGFCGCRHCREKWRQERGRGYPAIEQPSFFEVGMADPEYREWMHWRGKSLNDFRALIRAELNAIRPDLQHFKYTTAEQASPGIWGRGSDYESAMAVVDTVGTEINPVPFDSYPNLHALLKCRAGLSEASGCPAWAKFDITRPSAYFCWAFGRMDRQSLWWSLAPDNENPRPQDLLNWPWQMDDAAARCDADVGILLSGTTRDLSSDEGYYFREFGGWLQALLLAPQDVRVVMESELLGSPQVLERLRLLVLPNCSAITPEDAEALLAWVRAGGRLLMTADTGTLDAQGNHAPEPFLRHAGVSIQPGADPQPADPAVRGLGPPDGAPYAAEHRRVEVSEGTDVVATMTVGGEELPLLTRRGIGEGQVWYLAAKLGTLALEERQLSEHYRKGGFIPVADTRAVEIIQQVSSMALEGVACFGIRGAPRGLLATVYRTERGGRAARGIHLLNCSGRDLKPGDPVEFDADNPPPTPDLPELRLMLPGAVSEALLASPELDAPVALGRANEGGATVLTIPAETFSTYGVIWAYD